MQTDLLSNHFYHIYTHAVGSDHLFLSEDNYRYFLKQYAKYIHPIAETFAYCLMPNHVHFCIRIREEKVLQQIYLEKRLEKPLNAEPSQGSKPCEGFRDEKHQKLWLSQQFGHLFNSYTQAFNKQQNRQGSLFRSRFHRKVIENESYLRSVIRYIHQNPVLHGFVATTTDWHFSSYNAFLLPKETLIAKETVLEIFDGVSNFIEIHQERLAWEDWF